MVNPLEELILKVFTIHYFDNINCFSAIDLTTIDFSSVDNKMISITKLTLFYFVDLTSL